jgi:transposase
VSVEDASMGQKRPRYTAEFKAEAVMLYHASGKSLTEAARDIGVAKTTLVGWVKQAEIDGGRGPKGALTTEERGELIRLRRENRQVKQERDFLKKSAPSSPRRTRRALRDYRGGGGKLLGGYDVQAIRGFS